LSTEQAEADRLLDLCVTALDRGGLFCGSIEWAKPVVRFGGLQWDG